MLRIIFSLIQKPLITWFVKNFFLEYTKIYNESYGTSKSFVEKLINNGKDIVFDIDWYGLKALKKTLPDGM